MITLHREADILARPLPEDGRGADSLSPFLCGLPTGLRGKLHYDVPMSRHTSWKAGGLAERVYQPVDLDDLLVFLRSLKKDEPLYAVGLGSNLLVRDGGWRGTVLLLHGALNDLRLEHDDVIYAGAGVSGAKLARFAARHDLGGAEFFAGIPGTVGGMLAMNAGCYGSETWEKVSSALLVDRSGELHKRAPADYEIGYRHVAMKSTSDGLCTSKAIAREPARIMQEFFAGAWLRFEKGSGADAQGEIRALLSKRAATQPLNFPNAGSVFRNPQGDYAARLIQHCGLKGRCMGGAQVSEKHANFIVNTGNATATDIENLIEEVRVTVLRQTGIDLHPEVRIIGERPVQQTAEELNG